MSATMYKLPTTDEFAWVEDLSATVTSRLDEIKSALEAPFDGNPDTQAEPVTLEYLGRVFLAARTLRHDAEWIATTASKIEDAAERLRQIQEEDEGTLPDKETYIDYARRAARQWQERATSAAETLARADDGR